MSTKIQARREIALRPAMFRVADRMTVLSGTIEFPALPGLLDHMTQRLVDLFAGFARPFSDDKTKQLRSLLARALDQVGAEASSSRIAVNYKAAEGYQVDFDIEVRHITMEERYRTLESQRSGPLFGRVPDAMVYDVATKLGEPGQARVLDIGAGTGRNAIPLARLGHPVAAIEPTANFAEQVRTAASGEQLPVMVVEQDFLSPDCTIERGAYRLVVISEVLTHFRRIEDVRATFSKLADALSPGGMVVANLFVASDWYKPDALARQMGEMVWSCFYTEAELAFITSELPFEMIADEPVIDYERAKQSPKNWPPTVWFEDWANGRNVFETNPGIFAPLELRWLVFRRRA